MNPGVDSQDSFEKLSSNNLYKQNNVKAFNTDFTDLEVHCNSLNEQENIKILDNIDEDTLGSYEDLSSGNEYSPSLESEEETSREDIEVVEEHESTEDFEFSQTFLTHSVNEVIIIYKQKSQKKLAFIDPTFFMKIDRF